MFCSCAKEGNFKAAPGSYQSPREITADALQGRHGRCTALVLKMNRRNMCSRAVMALLSASTFPPFILKGLQLRRIFEASDSHIRFNEQHMRSDAPDLCASAPIYGSAVAAFV